MRDFIKAVINLTPLTADAWRYWRVYPNNVAACRGVYRSWEEAQAAAATEHRIRKRTDVLTYRAPEGVAIHPLAERDYPVLLHLAPLLRPGLRILNPGGSLAKEYASYRSLLPFPDGLDWRIREVPEVVEAGRAMLAAGDFPGLSFTTELAGAPDVFLICGALQYLRPGLAEALQSLERLPPHVFVSRSPMMRGAATFWTVQNIGSAAVPYRIENEDSFLAEMAALGYRLVDGWRDQRRLAIPFFPDGTVTGYLGAYFSRAG